MDLCSAFSTYSVSGLIKTNRTTTSKPHTIKLLTFFFGCSDLNEKQLLSFSTVDLLNPSMSNFRNDPGVLWLQISLLVFCNIQLLKVDGTWTIRIRINLDVSTLFSCLFSLFKKEVWCEAKSLSSFVCMRSPFTYKDTPYLKGLQVPHRPSRALNSQTAGLCCFWGRMGSRALRGVVLLKVSFSSSLSSSTCL